MVTLKQFTKHCDGNKLLPAYQLTYRKNCSCETSLVKLVDDLLWAMEEQIVTAVVILDFWQHLTRWTMMFYWKYWRRALESPIIQNNGTVAT